MNLRNAPQSRKRPAPADPRYPRDSRHPRDPRDPVDAEVASFVGFGREKRFCGCTLSASTSNSGRSRSAPPLRCAPQVSEEQSKRLAKAFGVRHAHAFRVSLESVDNTIIPETPPPRRPRALADLCENAVPPAQCLSTEEEVDDAEVSEVSEDAEDSEDSEDGSVVSASQSSSCDSEHSEDSEDSDDVEDWGGCELVSWFQVRSEQRRLRLEKSGCEAVRQGLVLTST